jgi:predicted GH43/DUF377 family glycosyl hydrolase
MIKVEKHGVIIAKTSHGFESEGVMNPAVIEYEGEIYVFYRAVSKGNYSSIGFCKLSDPLTVSFRQETPLLFPQLEIESHGMEDPRVVKIDDLFYFTYTAYDGVNALGALALSDDLVNFKKQGVIVAKITYEEFSHLAGSKDIINDKYLRFNKPAVGLQYRQNELYVWDKNVIFFPRRIKGKLCFIHRIRPDIQVVYITSLTDLTLVFWQHYYLHLSDNILLMPKYAHEYSYIGGGCPPLETALGWLLIYHSVTDSLEGYIYVACAALLDLENPQKEIGRLPLPLFKPEKFWELKGEVNNVCFPTGMIKRNDTLYIYYGAADEQIACVSVSLSALLQELLLNKATYEN